MVKPSIVGRRGWSYITPDSAPIETTIVAAPGAEPWQRIIGFSGVLPIIRSANTPADRACRGFLAAIRLGRPGLVGSISAYLRSVASVPGVPADFPARALHAPVAPSQALLTEAMTVLMRAGLIAIGGVWAPFPQVRLSDLKATFQIKEFIRREEGPAPHLYWPPGGKSGVSIGPGYDMKERTPSMIVTDLMSIGVSRERAAEAAGGAGLIADKAKAFANAHKDTLNLSPSQQAALLDVILPRYQDVVISNLPKSILPRIFAHEFDALVSLAYNVSNYGKHDPARWVRHLDLIAAAAGFNTLVGTGRGADLGLVARRARETSIFRDGVYRMPPLSKGLTDYQDAPIRGPKAG